MTQTVYIDILICVNLFINYFILLTVVKILNLSLKRFKLILASFIGALYSLIILLPQISFWNSLLIKLLMSFSIVLFAFGFMRLSIFLKVTASFYIINFIFAGVIFFIWYFVSSSGIFMKNGMIYFNISPLFLIVSTTVTYFVMKICNFLIGQKEIPLSFCTITIFHKEQCVKLKAKIDTGNTLREPFSNSPIIVTTYKAIKNLIEKELPEDFFKTCNTDILQKYITKNSLKIRMVPFKTIMGEGIIPAFKVDKLIIDYKNKTITKSAFIAICKDNTLCESFAALINPELLNLC